MTLEGSGASRLLQLFSGDNTHHTTITTAVIRTPLPNLSVRIDGETIDTPSQGIIYADGVKDKLTVNTRVIVAIANDGQLVYILDKAVI